MSGAGHNSGSGQLRAFVERILRLKEEQDTLAGDIREVYAEAKSMGFDKTAMGQLVGYIRKKDKNPEKVAEQSALFDLYLTEYERFSHAHTREAAKNEPAAATETAGDYLRKPVAVVPGQIVREGDAPRGTDHQASEQSPGDGGAPSPDTDSNPQPTSSPEADKGEAVPPSTASPAPSDEEPFEPPAFLAKKHSLRPDCLSPDNCAGYVPYKRIADLVGVSAAQACRIVNGQRRAVA